MAIQIKIKINGEEHEIGLNDARELFNDLKGVFDPELDKSCPTPDETPEEEESDGLSAFRKWREEHPNYLYPNPPIQPFQPTYPYQPWGDFPIWPNSPNFNPNSPILCSVHVKRTI